MIKTTAEINQFALLELVRAALCQEFAKNCTFLD